MQKVLICLTLLLAVGSTQNWAADFLGGFHSGMGLTINPYILPYISAQSLNYTGLYNAFYFIQYTSPQYKDAAISQFRDSFYNFSIGLYNILRQDYNFSVVLNYTLTVFASPQAFAQRAAIFRTRTGRDPYADISQYAGSLYFGSNYFFAGKNLGQIVYSLRQVANNLESKVDEPILRSLLHPDQGRDTKDPLTKDLTKDLTKNLIKDLSKDLTKDLTKDLSKQNDFMNLFLVLPVMRAYCLFQMCIVVIYNSTSQPLKMHFSLTHEGKPFEIVFIQSQA
eukprot:TRINITY_DN213_c0_g1_i2.p1 TRINITY_DN213_c0_g1~~TRINITY_DN213_c0_g1_i2.p1  ORF type:complete len:280 (-),score=90.38 TRINITY_DN213_c0_g1_i2:180-1019(-)